MDHDESADSRLRRLSPKAAALGLMVAIAVNGGCEMPSMPELPAIPGVYRIDIQQGNIVDQEMLDQLEIGMERHKVRFILGTPLLADPFNQDRWDYVYTLRPGSGPEARQRVTVYFVDDRLTRVDDHLQPGVVPEAEERTQTLVKVPKRRSRKGILDKLTPDFLKRDDEPVSDPAAGGAQRPAE